MGEYTTPVAIDLGQSKPKKEDHKCLMCGFSGSQQERYDHELGCLTQAQEQVKAIIRAEKEQMRMMPRPQR